MAESFDVRAYARTAQGSLRAEVDTAGFEAEPLGAEALEAIAYLRGLERGTVTHLRRVLVTATHKDARVTAFLISWAFEKHWIADALTAVLEAHPDTPIRDSARAEGLLERLSPIGRSIAANAFGEHLVAVHVTTGAIDELLTSHAYARLDRLAAHPSLSRLLQAIGVVKARHADFFQQETRRRLSSSHQSQAVARLLLRGRSWPIGASDLVPAVAERGRVLLFAASPAAKVPAATARGELDRIDKAIALLPGLEGLAIAERLGARSSLAHVRVGERLGRVAAEGEWLAERGTRGA